MTRRTKKTHAFHTAEQPPLCGQKDRTGKRFLSPMQTSAVGVFVTCAKCLDLLGTPAQLRPACAQKPPVDNAFVAPGCEPFGLEAAAC